MLVPFKTDYEKITMGLLSYVPDLKETIHLTNVLDWYKQENTRYLYLWRSEETEDMCGVIGLEEEDDLIILRHIAVNPSYRQEGISYEMIEAISEKFENKSIVGTIETGKLVTKWQKRHDKHEEIIDSLGKNR